MEQNYLPDFLIKMLEEQYGKELTEKIIEGYSANRLTTLRVNTLKADIDKIKCKLEQVGIEYENVSWSDEALILKNTDKNEIEKLKMYEKGEIYLQSLSSMLPPIVLQPKQGEDILDMTAAPGGKTTQIAAIIENKANITACEMNSIRAERLKYNIQKHGATCIYVMQIDSRRIDSFFSFDRILLDAPCSGSGTLNSNDNKIKKYFTQKLIDKSTKTQVALLKKALEVLKPGKEMVYSTCSILACENEYIIKKVLQNIKAEVVPIELKGIEDIPTLPTQIKGTICIAPTEKYEGFFACKIRKV